MELRLILAYALIILLIGMAIGLALYARNISRASKFGRRRKRCGARKARLRE